MLLLLFSRNDGAVIVPPVVTTTVSTAYSVEPSFRTIRVSHRRGKVGERFLAEGSSESESRSTAIARTFRVSPKPEPAKFVPTLVTGYAETKTRGFSSSVFIPFDDEDDIKRIMEIIYGVAA